MEDFLLMGLALAALAVVAGAWAARRGKRRTEAGRSLEGSIAACQLVQGMVGHLQQHRGMSSAFLSGDEAFAGRLVAKAREIDALFPELLKVAREEGERAHPCLTRNDLALFRHRWEELREKLATLSVEQSIAQHSFLIDRLLYWLTALGEARLEPLVGERLPRGLVRNFAYRLPALTECLGQTRAVGSSVAARQGCSPVARVRLMFLVARAETLLGQALEAAGADPAADSARFAIQEMARVVRTQMLLSSGVGVSAADYFALSTRAIDSVFAWIRHSGARLAAGEGAAASPAGFGFQPA